MQNKQKNGFGRHFSTGHNDVTGYLSLWEYECFKEELRNKEKFYSMLTDWKISRKEYEHVLNAREKIEMKTMKDYLDLYLKC